jgi:hypothetical protein
VLLVLQIKVMQVVTAMAVDISQVQAVVLEQ